MADNVTLNAGTGGAVLATDDIGGVHYQIVKMAFGALETGTLVTSSVGMPIGDAGGSLTVDNNGTFVVQIDGSALTALQLIDDAVAADGQAYGKGVIVQGDDGTDRRAVLVDTDGHLQIDVLTGGGGTQYAEDAVHSTGASGNIALAVRNDTLESLSGADGDYSVLQVNASGALYVAGSGTFTVDGSAVTQPISAASLPLPAGASTSANQSTANTALSAIQTSVGLLDNAISGSEMQVDVVSGGGGTEYTVDAAAPSTPSGGTFLMERDDAITTLTPVEGDWQNPLCSAKGALWVAIDNAPLLGANTGVDIGDVDVTSVIPGTSATSLGKAIDAVAGATDTGVAIVAIRDDTLSALTPIEGDWTPLRVTSTGALHVTGGGTQYNVDVAAGAADTGSLMLAVRDDTLGALTPIDGDYTQLRVNSQGALHVTGAGGGTEYTVDNAAPGTPTGKSDLMMRDDALAALTPVEGDWQHMLCTSKGALWVGVDGSVAVTNAGTFVVQVDGAALTALQLIDDAVGADATAYGKGVLIQGDDGTDRRAVLVDTDGHVKVDLVSAAVTNAGTFVTQIDGAALTALQLIDDTVFTDDAAFTPATSKLIVVGAQADDATPDSVDEGDAGALRMSLARQLRTVEDATTTGGATMWKSLDLDETEEDVKASAGQIYMIHAINLKASVLYLKVYNNIAATVVVGTTVPDWTFPVPTLATTNGAGFCISFPTGIACSTGICVACTTGFADADAGAPGANEMIVNIAYK